MKSMKYRIQKLAELLIYDHPADAEVMIDKYGISHTISDIRQPVSDFNVYGRSIVSELSKCDNAMWLDYMFACLSDLFGNRYDEWIMIRNKRSPE